MKGGIYNRSCGKVSISGGKGIEGLTEGEYGQGTLYICIKIEH
jgi:hypothetical protein